MSINRDFEMIDRGQIPDQKYLLAFETEDGVHETVLPVGIERPDRGTNLVSAFYVRDGFVAFSTGCGRYETLEEARARCVVDLGRTQAQRVTTLYHLKPDGTETYETVPFHKGDMFSFLERHYLAQKPEGWYAVKSDTGSYLCGRWGVSPSRSEIPLRFYEHIPSTLTFWAAIRRVRDDRNNVPGQQKASLSPAKISPPVTPKSPRRKPTLYYLDANADIRRVEVFDPLTVCTIETGKIKYAAHGSWRYITACRGYLAFGSGSWFLSTAEPPSVDNIQVDLTFAEGWKLLCDRRDKLKVEDRAARKADKAATEPYSFRGKLDVKRVIRENPGKKYILVHQSNGIYPWIVIDSSTAALFFYSTKDRALAHGKHEVYPGAFDMRK